MDFSKEQQRNEQQQILHYRKGIQEAEVQFVFTGECLSETDRIITEEWIVYQRVWTASYGAKYGFGWIDINQFHL